MLFGGLSEPVGLFPGDNNGIVVVSLPVLSACFLPVAHGKAVGHPIGVTGDEKLREYDELSSHFSGLCDQIQGFFHAGLPLKHNRRGLNHGKLTGLFQIFHAVAPFKSLQGQLKSVSPVIRCKITRSVSRIPSRAT